MKRMQKDRIAKVDYVGECAGSRSVSRLRKRCSTYKGISYNGNDIFMAA